MSLVFVNRLVSGQNCDISSSSIWPRKPHQVDGQQECHFGCRFARTRDCVCSMNAFGDEAILCAAHTSRVAPTHQSHSAVHQPRGARDTSLRTFATLLRSSRFSEHRAPLFRGNQKCGFNTQKFVSSRSVVVLTILM